MVTITALALMGLTFLISKPRDINARLFALICLSTSTYIVLTMQYQSDPSFRIDLSAYWLPMQILNIRQQPDLVIENFRPCIIEGRPYTKKRSAFRRTFGCFVFSA